MNSEFICDRCGCMYDPKHPTGDQFFCCGQKMRRITGCEYFHWIGASSCDRCGRPAKEHKGVVVHREGGKLFGDDGPESSPSQARTWLQIDLNAGWVAVVV